MSNDVPTALLEMQEWFSNIITTRLEDDDTIAKKTISGNSIIEEAKLYVTPSHTLEPYERMEIYNKGYWYRLLDILIDAFPLVSRLFGAYDFNQKLAIPYLMKHPSQHWDLNFLGNRFVQYLEESYHEKDRKLILFSAKVDWACQESFFVEAQPALDTHLLKPEEILSKQIKLQPHIQLFEFPYDLISYREAFLKEEVDFWIDHDFPKLSKQKAPSSYFFILFRSLQPLVEIKAIDEAEFFLLKSIQKGKTIEEALEEVEQIGGTLYKETETKIAFWLQEWLLRKWLY